MINGLVRDLSLIGRSKPDWASKREKTMNDVNNTWELDLLIKKLENTLKLAEDLKEKQTKMNIIDCYLEIRLEVDFE